MADSMLILGRVHEDDNPQLLLAQERARSRTETFRAEVRIRSADGGWRWSSFVATPRPMADGSTCWDGIEMIVTERKRAEEERDRFEAQLRQREKIDAIGQLAAGIAHDFNNQLMGVMGNADLLAFKFSDPVIADFVRKIKTSAQRAAGLTAQLLAFGRKGKFKSVVTNTHQLISEVMDLLARSIDKRIEIASRMEAKQPNVLGDPTLLQNAILNLGLNARDAMQHGGVLTFATRQVDIAQAVPGEELAPGRFVQISVSDTGTGMDAATKRRIFEPFFTTKEVGKGTGLGLASVYGTVRSHAGAIRVDSEVGRGSTFTILLPCALDPLAAISPAAGMPVLGPGPAHSLGQIRILVVDDEPLVLELCGALLRDQGYATELCANPVEALKRYREDWSRIDLVILDLVMPKIGGKDLYLALREINPGIKVIVSSGYSCNFEVQSILDAGAVAFVQKPFQLNELSRTITEVLGRSPPPLSASGA